MNRFQIVAYVTYKSKNSKMRNISKFWRSLRYFVDTLNDNTLNVYLSKMYASYSTPIKLFTYYVFFYVKNYT